MKISHTISAALLATTVVGVGAQSGNAISVPSIRTTTVVNLRPTPDTSQAPLGTIPAGVSPDFICFAYGQYVGGVRVWFKVNYAGRTGYFASYYDTSSYTSEANLIAKYGIPKCGTAPAPAPAPVGTAAERAVNWALAQQGSRTYDYWCLKFVADAYRYGAGTSSGTAGWAKQYWDQHYSSQHRGSGQYAPRGALVFWSWAGTLDGVYRDWGHVALSLGDGRVVTSLARNVPGVHIMNIGTNSLGWIMP